MGMTTNADQGTWGQILSSAVPIDQAHCKRSSHTDWFLSPQKYVFGVTSIDKRSSPWTLACAASELNPGIVGRFTKTLFPSKNALIDVSCSGNRLAKPNWLLTSSNALCHLSSANAILLSSGKRLVRAFGPIASSERTEGGSGQSESTVNNRDNSLGVQNTISVAVSQTDYTGV